MKHLKILALTALATTALMVFASSASATSFTAPIGTTYTGTVKAVGLQGGVSIYSQGQLMKQCKAEFAWKVESHGPTVTAKGAVTSFALPECGIGFTLLKPGLFEFHTLTSEVNNGSGTITWTGVQMTTTWGGVSDCVYELDKPFFANLTGSKVLSGKTPTIDFEANWHSLFCTATEWKAYFQVTSPDYLDVD